MPAYLHAYPQWRTAGRNSCDPSLSHLPTSFQRPPALLDKSIKIKTNTTLLIMHLVPRCDEPGTTLERRQVHPPLEPDHQADAKADQEHKMQEQPQDPS